MKKILKNPIFTFILGAIIFGGISTSFAYTFIATDVGFSPTDYRWEVEEVSTALNDIRTSVTDYDYGSMTSAKYGTWQSIELGYEPRMVVFIGPTSGGYVRSYIYIKGQTGTAYSRGSKLYTENASGQIQTYNKGFKWYVKDSSWGSQTIYYYAFK